MRQLHLPMRVWDAPTRLFHWVLIVLIATSWVTQYENWMEWHKLSGYSILTLLLFRLAWGFVGSDTARFARFLKSPLAALRHVSHITRREPDYEIGHNAAGGWMVLVMLLLLLVQAVSGLFSNDDIDTEGPLTNQDSKEQSDWFSHIHSINFTLIEIVIALHVLAIIAYAVLKRQDLVRPMVTGKKRMPGATRPPRMASSILAVVLLIVAAGVVAALVRYG
jgi:cytochrome b